MICPNCQKNVNEEFGICLNCRYELWKDVDKNYETKMCQKIDEAKNHIRANNYESAKQSLKEAEKHFEEFESYTKKCSTKIHIGDTRCFAKMMEASKIDGKILKKNLKKGQAIFWGCVASLILLFLIFGRGESSSSKKECIYCHKTISSGSVCDNCQKWLNDAGNAANDYNNKYN